MFLEIIEGCFPPRLYVHKYSSYLYIYVFGDLLSRAYNNPRGKMGGVDTIIEGGYLDIFTMHGSLDENVQIIGGGGGSLKSLDSGWEEYTLMVTIESFSSKRHRNYKFTYKTI